MSEHLQRSDTCAPECADGDSLAAPTVLHAFRRQARQRPAKTAIRFLPEGSADAGDEDIASYAALEQRVDGIAAFLHAAGAAGERVLLLMPPGIDYIAGFLACVAAGALAVPAYPPGSSAHAQRIARIAADADARFVLCHAAQALRRNEAVPAPESPLHRAQWIAVDASEPGDVPVHLPQAPAEGLAFLQYTSGSTTEPRGVQVTHANLMAHARWMRDALAQDADDVFVSWLPLFHDMGLIGMALQALAVGATLVLMPPAAFLQRPLRWLQAIHRHGGTVAYAPNFAFDLCCDAAEADPAARATLQLSQWRVVGNAAEPVSQRTMQRFHQCFAAQGLRWQALTAGYGLAEATLTVGVAPVRTTGFAVDARSLEAGRLRPALPATPAAPAPRSRVLVRCGTASALHIVDPDSARPRAEGEVGEVWLQGPLVAAGYWGRPEESARVFQARLADGRGPFLRTGDLGALVRGELYVVGRLKDLIIVRGQNHHPADLEHTALAAHAALARVAAVPVDGALEGVALVAELRREARRSFDGETIVAALRAAVAEAHALDLQAVVLVRPATLPLTSSGKLQRRTCRQQFEEGRLAALFTWQAEVPAGQHRAQPPGVAPSPPPDLDTLMQRPAEEARQALADLLFDLLAQALRFDAERRAALRPGFEQQRLSMLGLESLAAIELSSSVGKALQLDVPVADVLGGQTAGEVITQLQQQLTLKRLMARPASATAAGSEAPGEVWVL